MIMHLLLTMSDPRMLLMPSSEGESSIEMVLRKHHSPFASVSKAKQRETMIEQLSDSLRVPALLLMDRLLKPMGLKSVLVYRTSEYYV